MSGILRTWLVSRGAKTRDRTHASPAPRTDGQAPLSEKPAPETCGRGSLPAFRTWRAHRIAGSQSAPDLLSAPLFNRPGRTDRARTVLLLVVQAPAEGPPPAIAHPLLGRTLAHDGLRGRPTLMWQMRLPGPLDHRALGRLLRPPAEALGRRISDVRQAMRAIRLRHPWAAFDRWLRAAVETRLLAEAPGGGCVLGRALLAHDLLTLAAAEAPR